MAARVSPNTCPKSGQPPHGRTARVRDLSSTHSTGINAYIYSNVGILFKVFTIVSILAITFSGYSQNEFSKYELETGQVEYEIGFYGRKSNGKLEKDPKSLIVISLRFENYGSTEYLKWTIPGQGMIERFKIDSIQFTFNSDSTFTSAGRENDFEFERFVTNKLFHKKDQIAILVKPMKEKFLDLECKRYLHCSWRPLAEKEIRGYAIIYKGFPLMLRYSLSEEFTTIVKATSFSQEINDDSYQSRKQLLSKQVKSN